MKFTQRRQPMMIDIHSHILFGVDDGPEVFEHSLDMLRAAASRGIRVIFATPHILDSSQSEELILANFRKITAAIIEEKIPIDCYLGSEINFQFGMEAFLEWSMGTYRGMGRYFLVETTLSHYPRHFDEIMDKMIRQGYRPVFAHPERVGPITGDRELISCLVDSGLLIQINSGSLLGLFGGKIQTFAWELLDHGLAHFVASDAHGMRHRTINLDSAWNEISTRYDEGLAELLLWENPRRIVTGEHIEFGPVKR